MDPSSPAVGALDPAAANAIAACLERTQRELLAAGYAYAAGDPDTWPLSPVLMVREGAALLVGPLLPPPPAALDLAALQAAEMKQRGVPLRGAILVGGQDVGDALADDFHRGTGVSIACLDAAAGAFRASRGGSVFHPPPGALRDRALRRFMDGSADRTHGGLDCRQRLAAAMAELREVAQFQAETVAGGGAPVPYGTYILMAVCIGVFAAMVVTGRQAFHPSLDKLLAWGASHGPPIKAGQYWRLLTCMFLHVGLVHLLFNTYAAYAFGPPLERFQGTWRMAVYFLFGGLAGGVTSLWWHPDVVSAGASGGLFGMAGGMAAIIVRYWRDLPPAVRRGLRKWLVNVLVYNGIFLIVPFVDGAAHVGGFVGGFLMGVAISCPPRRQRLPGPVSVAAAIALLAGLAAFAIYAIRSVPA